MKNRAFTLVELLVMIGIIGVLIALLVPTVGAVRRASWNASSLNTMNNLRVAIEAYHNDHQTYPGLFANPALMLVNGVPMTSTENMIVSLLGGITAVPASGATGTVVFDPAEVGRGQRGFNALNPIRYRAYLQPGAMSLPDQPWTAWRDDSEIPEAMDAYPDAMPILYLRARVGAANIIAANDTAQYNSAHLAPYGFTGASPDLVAYFTNTSTGAARNRDGYILILAGPDRIYGTVDDILN